MSESKTVYIQHSGEAEANETLGSLLGERFRAYRRDWQRASDCELLTEFPMFLCLEESYVCNLTCVHCIHGYDDMRAAYDYHQDMGWALFQRVIDEASDYGCPSMSPNNINEPLLARDLVERVEYASKKGFIDISMQTNALLLTERTSERLLDSGLTRLHVSLDALTQPTYDRIRRGSNFDKVMRNVDTFLDLRARRGRKLPLLRVSLVRLTVNEHEIPAFVDYWRERADYIAIQEFLSPFPGRAEFEPFFTESRTTLSDFRCPQPWQRVVVQGDGEVQPCCSFFSRELTMGNVKTTPLRDIWRSPAMDRLRALHRDGRYLDEPVCAKCVTNWIGKGRAAVVPS